MFVAPPLLLGVLSWLRTRAWLCLAASFSGLLLAALPTVVGGKPVHMLGEARYMLLALPFLAWPVAAGAAAVAGALLARWRSAPVRVLAVVVLLLPAVGAGVAGATSLHGWAEWEADFDFLRRSLDVLPERCTLHVVFLEDLHEPGKGNDGTTIQLALPHPLLVLGHRDVAWRVHGDTAPSPAEDDACEAVVLGATCAMAALPPDARRGGTERHNELFDRARPHCDRLRQRAAGSPTLAASYPVGPEARAAEIVRSGILKLRMWRLR